MHRRQWGGGQRAVEAVNCDIRWQRRLLWGGGGEDAKSDWTEEEEKNHLIRASIMYWAVPKGRIKWMKTQLEIITGRIISSYLSTVDGGEISRLQVPNQNRRVGGIRLEKKHRKRKDADDLGKRNRVMVGEDRRKGVADRKKNWGIKKQNKTTI